MSHLHNFPCSTFPLSIKGHVQDSHSFNIPFQAKWTTGHEREFWKISSLGHKWKSLVLDHFQKPSLGGRLNTKPGDHGTLNAHNFWFTLFYHVWGPAWIENHWNNIWLRDWSHMTSHYTWGPVTPRHASGGVLGRRPLDTFLLGSHNFTVTALGSWLKWPLRMLFFFFSFFWDKRPTCQRHNTRGSWPHGKFYVKWRGDSIVRHRTANSSLRYGYLSTIIC